MSSFRNTFLRENNTMDLNIHNYSCEDLFKLFDLETFELTVDILKEIKRRIIKTHPDKSNLPSEYYIFFAEAYNILFRIFKNTVMTDTQKQIHKYEDNTHHQILDNFFKERKEFKKSENFNLWFNDKFDKYYIKDDVERNGYEDWLKSDEGIINQPNVTENKFREEFDNLKRKNAVIIHEEVNSNLSNSSFARDVGIDLQLAYSNTMLSYPNDNTYSNNESVQEHINNRKLNDVELMNKKGISELLKKNKIENLEGLQYAFRQIQHSKKQKEELNLFWKDMKLLE